MNQFCRIQFGSYHFCVQFKAKCFLFEIFVNNFFFSLAISSSYSNGYVHEYNFFDERKVFKKV